jgi:hypothetical protein
MIKTLMKVIREVVTWGVTMGDKAFIKLQPYVRSSLAHSSLEIGLQIFWFLYYN